MSLVSSGKLESESDAHDQGAARCWFFVHVPKTAGSSFGQELCRLLSPHYNVHIEDDHRAITYSEKIAEATKAFNQRLSQGPCRFASGHIPVTTLRKHLENWRDLNLITMLREPARRVISDYRYQRTPAHPSHRDFIKNFPTLDSYIVLKRARNKIFRYLRPSEKASVGDCIQFVDDHFAFVGIVEMYQRSFRLVTKLMDKERQPSRFERKTIDTEYNQIEITPELIRRIHDLNEFDLELYTHFRKRLRDLRPMVASQPDVAVLSESPSPGGDSQSST